MKLFDFINKKGKQIIVFLFFLIAAAIGWFINKLSDEYLFTINVPIELYNSADQRQVYTVKTDVNAQVYMRGYIDLEYKIAPKDFVRIDLGDKKLSTNNRNYILAADVTSRIAEQIGNNKRLVGISPDTIKFSLNEKQNKLLPVVANLKLSFAKEFMQRAKTMLTPDSIWVSAPDNILDTMTAVYCAPREYKNLSSSVSGTLDLIYNETEKISFEKYKIQFNVDVERYSEGVVKAPIQILNQPDNVDVMLLPNEVEILYRAPVNDFANIQANKFRLVVDYSDFEKSISGNIRITVAEKPQNVLYFKLNPEFVEAIINKK